MDQDNPPRDRTVATLHKLLGDLEVEIMELMWERRQATVRDILVALRPTRPRAYTTIMTVMLHLAEKGLLQRHQPARKTYVYTIAQTRDEYLSSVAGQMIDGLVADFGDRALAVMRRRLDQGAGGSASGGMSAGHPPAPAGPIWDS